MRYFFGQKQGTLEENFNAHQSVCPYCKSENTEGSRSFDEKTKSYWNHKQCSCGGKWIPKEPTQNNLDKFKVFVKDCEEV